PPRDPHSFPTRRSSDLLSNLVATGQLRMGDWIRVDCDAQLQRLNFYKDAEEVAAEEMAAIASASTGELAAVAAAPACAESSPARSEEHTSELQSLRHLV